MLDRIEGDERLLFFKVGEDTRKVTVSEPPRTMHEITRLLTTRFDNINTSAELEYWIKDQKFGVRYQISSTEDVYNGAVLEVITRTKKAPKPKTRVPIIERKPRLRPERRFNSFSQNVGMSNGWPSLGPPSMPRSPPPMLMRPPPMAMGLPPISMGQPPKSNVDVRMCSVHNKERTLMNLSKNDEGRWVCNPDSQCKTASMLALGEETCSIHNKVRTLPNLEKNRDGKWICIEGARCKVQKKKDGFGGGFRGGFGRGRKSAYIGSSRTFNGRHAPYPRRGRGAFRGGPSFGRIQKRSGFRAGMGRGGMVGISRGGFEGFRRSYDPPGFQSRERFGSPYEPPAMMGAFNSRDLEFSGGYGPGRENFRAPGRRPGLIISERRGGGFGLQRRGRGMGFDRKDSGLLCRIHGKFRTRANMKSMGNGGWECLPNSKCK